MIIGFTGHQKLDDESLWTRIRPVIAGEIKAIACGNPMIGVSCLAEGADQIFAEEILKLGGDLTAVIPCENYPGAFKSEAGLKKFERLLCAAEITIHLPHQRCTQRSFFDAGQRVVDESVVILAVWDGFEAKGLGGTADVVEYAGRNGKATHCIDPITQSMRIIL